MIEYVALGAGVVCIGVCFIQNKHIRELKAQLTEETQTRKAQDDKLYYMMTSQMQVMTNQPTQWERRQQEVPRPAQGFEKYPSRQFERYPPARPAQGFDELLDEERRQ